MSANDYTVEGYIEAGYFTTSSSAGVTYYGEAAITAAFAASCSGDVTEAQPQTNGGNDYTVADYIVDGYFTSSQAPSGTTQEGAADLSVAFGIISDVGNIKESSISVDSSSSSSVSAERTLSTSSSLETSISVQAQGYRTQEIVCQSFGIAGIAANIEVTKRIVADLLTNTTTLVDANKYLNGNVSLICQSSFNVQVIRYQQGNAVLLSLFDFDVETAQNIRTSALLEATTSQTAVGDKTSSTSATLLSNAYVQAQGYRTQEIVLEAFGIAGIAVDIQVTRNLEADLSYAFGTATTIEKILSGDCSLESQSLVQSIVGKVIEATTTITVEGGGTYVESGYIDETYFEGGSVVTPSITGAFTLIAELTFVAPPVEAYANINVIASSIVNTSILFEGYASFNNPVLMSINVSKLLDANSNLDVQLSTSTDAQRARGITETFSSDFAQSTINSRIRDNDSQMVTEFNQVTYGSRDRDIDLFAFSDAAITAQVNVIRDSNTLANTFFNVGTDFIRQRDVSAEADDLFFISNIPTRIRDTSLETQDAFSFASTAVATRDISLSLVTTSIQEPSSAVVIRDAVSSCDNIVSFNISIDIIRNFDCHTEINTTQTTNGVSTLAGVSTIDSSITLNGYGNATLDCDMVAFDDVAVMTKANARFRANSEMFCIPGFTMVIRNVRVRYNASNVTSTLSSTTFASEIHPFIGEPFVSTFTNQTIPTQLYALKCFMTHNVELEATGIVRFYFFPTNFSMSVLDEPLADTTNSRTRETGVNI